jgi:hypothetical protein
MQKKLMHYFMSIWQERDIPTYLQGRHYYFFLAMIRNGYSISSLSDSCLTNSINFKTNYGTKTTI